MMQPAHGDSAAADPTRAAVALSPPNVADAGRGRTSGALGARVSAGVRAVARVNWSVVGTVLAVKAVLLVFGVVAAQLILDLHYRSLAEMADVWRQWDANQYLDLAQNGYDFDSERRILFVFFPMYPLLVRATAALTGDYYGAALVVSTLASVAVGLLLYALVRLDGPDELAYRAVWFLFIFPTSYFLHTAYTESLFLTFVLGCVLAARKERWALAGAFGACAGFTRLNGLLLLPVLLVEVFECYRRTRRWDPRWLWVALAAGGTLAYLALNYVEAGDALFFLEAQRSHWVKSLAWPWDGIQRLRGFMEWPGGAQSQYMGLHELTFIALGFAGAVGAWLALRPSYAVWMTLNWLLFASNSFIQSTPRYTLTLFPLFILFAALARNRVWNAAITTWSLLFLALFTTHFVMGRWAF
jgi:hypothetical protein